jgi:NADH-ubiquinone oxidoreductase chain 3
MSSMTIFIIVVTIIALLFLFINLVFAPHNPYQEKDSMFECGFHSFQQSRSPFNIAFFIYALVYLLLDLEILLTFPFAVSGYVNNIYGLIVTLGFVGIITIGFVYELGKGALKIPSKQHSSTAAQAKATNNLPVIDITFIELKSIIKPHTFISYPPLQSSIFPFVKKHFNSKNIIRGLIGLTIVTAVKTLHISEYILTILSLDCLKDYIEYFIVAVLGLLPFMGEGIKNIFVAVAAAVARAGAAAAENNYAMMGGDPTDPTVPDSSMNVDGTSETDNKVKGSSGSSSGVAQATQPVKESKSDSDSNMIASDDDDLRNAVTQKEINSQKSSTSKSESKSEPVSESRSELEEKKAKMRRSARNVNERLTGLFDTYLKEINEEIRESSQSKGEAKTDEESEKFDRQMDNLLKDLAFLEINNEVSAEKKSLNTFSPEAESSKKRDLEAEEKEDIKGKDTSKKRKS